MNTPLVSRRTFVAGGAGIALLFALGGVGVLADGAAASCLRPPGGQDENRFLSLCISCDRCRQACPQDVIKSAGIEAGLVGWRAPVLDFRSHALERTLGTTEYHDSGVGWCNFCDPECEGGKAKKCVAACPTGALAAFDEREQKVGVAVIDTIYCIAYPQIGQSPTGCRVCVEVCPYGAVSLDEAQHPMVDVDLCNGCGKCESNCPSASYRQFIGISELEERAAEGNDSYADSLAYYNNYRSVPRGINVMLQGDVESGR